LQFEEKNLIYSFMNRPSKIARLAKAAMWVMIGVILLSFFFTGAWIRKYMGCGGGCFLLDKKT